MKYYRLDAQSSSAVLCHIIVLEEQNHINAIHNLVVSCIDNLVVSCKGQHSSGIGLLLYKLSDRQRCTSSVLTSFTYSMAAVTNCFNPSLTQQAASKSVQRPQTQQRESRNLVNWPLLCPNETSQRPNKELFRLLPWQPVIVVCLKFPMVLMWMTVAVTLHSRHAQSQRHQQGWTVLTSLFPMLCYQHG